MELDLFSNATPTTNHTSCPQPNTYTKVAGTILFIAIWPLIVFDFRKFPLARGGSALLGATLMVVFNVITQQQAYDTLGNKNNLETLFLLIGMLLMNYYFDRENFLPVIAKRIFGQGKPFYQILWKVCLFSGVLSSLVTNDATCIAITPVFVELHIRQKRSDKEILPLLLGIATSANIGSAATIFGNPQNALIAASTNIDLLTAFATLLPAAVVGLVLNTIMLYAFCVLHKVGIEGLRQGPMSGDQLVGSQDNNVDLVGSHSNFEQQAKLHESLESGPALLSTSNQHREQLHNQLETAAMPQQSHGQSLYSEVLQTQLTESMVRYSSHYGNTRRRRPYYSLPTRRQMYRYGTLNTVDSVEHSMTGDTPTEVVRLNNEETTPEEPAVEDEAWWRPRVFHVWLLCALLLIIILLSIPSSVVEFNLGLVPIGVATFTMVIDAFTRKKSSYFAITKIDWYLIVMFMGLFVWLEGFKETGFPCEAFDALKDQLQLCKFEGVMLFTVFMMIGSNAFSNVPLVILIINQLSTICNLSCTKSCDVLGGVLLAWVSTVSGNFTLFGSVANLIVAEKSKLKAEEDELNLDNNTITKYHFKFFDYLKFGPISTVIITLFGLPIIYFTARHFPIA